MQNVLVAILMTVVVGALPSSGADVGTAVPQGPKPCSNTGTKRTAEPVLIVTGKSTDCNNDGTLDCGYEEIYWPAIFGCDAPGSAADTCCDTFTAFSQKRVFTCGGTVCTTPGWVNDQAFTQAQPVACNGANNADSCN